MSAKYLKKANQIAKIYHILNGDALAEHFPVAVKGSRIIFREMLMDGELSTELDQAFYELRARFISRTMGEKLADYMDKVPVELDKIKTIEPYAEVYLWFEYDLFCQINFWACCYWLEKYGVGLKLFWVKPDHRDWIGFGIYRSEQLADLMSEAEALSAAKVKEIIFCLETYKTAEFNLISEVIQANKLSEELVEALKMQLLRLPDDEGKIALADIILKIKEQNNGDFARSFQVFSRLYGNFGLGDLQFLKQFESL